MHVTLTAAWAVDREFVYIVFGPPSPKMIPKGTQGEPKDPKGNPKIIPKGAQGPPKGVPRGPKAPQEKQDPSKKVQVDNIQGRLQRNTRLCYDIDVSRRQY